MLTYRTPVDEITFTLVECLNLPDVAREIGYENLDSELVTALIKGAGAICEQRLLPLNGPGDAQGCRLTNGRVTTPNGFAEAYRELIANGLIGLSHPAEQGGQGLPLAIARAVAEIRNSTCMAIAGFAELAEGVAIPLENFGSDDLKRVYLPKISSGAWAGAMHLTEPQAGSDLGQIQCRAELAKDGSYRLYGTKIFISCADQDFTENVVNLVLARLPDAPSGIPGISLFVASNYILDGDGTPGARNAFGYTGLEEKMGLHGSVTGTIAHDGTVAHLVGKPGEGLAAMFSMVNETRIGTGVQALGVAETALQTARAYANERLQGRDAATGKGPVAIVNHVDVRRMLQRIESFTLPARHLGLWAALQVDIAAHHPDQQKRDAASALASMMTGVVKVFFSEEGFACTDTAIQVFGGYGYMREQGLEQLLRDVRITRIYEGANNILAQDLAKRRLWIGDGEALETFLTQIEDEAREAPDPRLLAEETLELVQLLRICIAGLKDQGGPKSPVITAAATDLMTMVAHTAMAWSWLRLLNAASTTGRFPTARIADMKTAATYYAEWRIPEALQSASRILRLCKQAVEV